MIEVQSNISLIVNVQLSQLKELINNSDAVVRTVALTVLPELKKRVHVNGKDSDGNQIGTYSAGYMVVRTGAYKNADAISKGVNKGKLKNAGKFTKGTNIKVIGTVVEDTAKAGAARPKYNRSSDTKVIFSLTRQMENDMSVVDTQNGYGIGYLNKDNLQKALYCEETYQKKVLTELSKEELELAIDTAQNFTEDYFKNME